MNAPPSINPADDDSLLGMANLVLRKFLQGVDDMLPARVVSYDPDSNRVTLAPMVALLTTAGEQVARAQVAEVPVFRYGAGGFVLRFNLKAGDLGWIKSNDRDISMFLQSWGGGPPNTLRMHTFEDSMFFPDALRNVVVLGEDEEAVTLQSLDGTHRVVVAEDRVSLVAGASRLDLTAAGANYTGGPFVINGIPFGSHRHTDVDPGEGTSGGPVA